MARIVCCGEGMLELACREREWNVGYGGDTLNTAIHLTRFGHQTAYLTAVGSDPLSVRLKDQWATEKLDTSLVTEHPTRTVGLYAISLDSCGERSFTYWRESSAAREMFGIAGSLAAVRTAEQCELLYFSLITLAILPPEGRETLLALARRVRVAGGQVAYDNNYRARLWSSAAEANGAHQAAIAVADIGLPTLDDEKQLTGVTDAQTVLERWHALGCSQVVIKLGADGCILSDGERIGPATCRIPVDSSGAGDAFNAGYLAAALAGASPARAARAGHRIADWVILRRGAIPARDAAAPYD